MKKKRPFHWFSNRFLLIISATLIIIYLLSTTLYSYSQPAPKTVFPSATITKIYEDKSTPSCRILPELRKPSASMRDGRRITNIVNQKMQPNNDLLQTFKCWVVLSFPQWNFEASLGGNQKPSKYWFPKIAQAEKFVGSWKAAQTGLFNVAGDKNSILIMPVTPKKSPQRSGSSNFPTNLVAQATTDLPQISIPGQKSAGELRYCSAISDFSVIPKTPMREKPPYESEYGKAWGIGISDRGWDLFSQNDPCGKALQECETANQNLRNVKNPKLGTTCSISSDGIGLQPLDDSDVILTLDCSGDKEKPFSRRVIPYETQAAKIDEALIKNFKKKARDDGARSCIFNIYPNVSGSLLVSPAQPKEGSVKIEADGSGKKVEFVTVNGSAGVIPIEKLVKTEGRATPEIVPHHNKYFFCEENDRECEKDEHDEYVFKPVSASEIDQIKSQEPVNLLPRDPTIFSPEDTIGILTISGKRINPWKDLGFYLNFPSGLDFPSEWKAVTEPDELKTVLGYIQQKEPPLALSYVDGALTRLERRDPELASTFRGEITSYLNPKIDRRLLAVDVQSVASVQAEQKSLSDSISFETVTKNYVKNLRRTRSSLVRYVSDKSFAVGNFKIWEVKVQVNLQGSYGAPKRGYKKEPAIGAGRTVFVEGTDGKPVTLIQTSYFINRQNQLFKLDFITTQERDKLFTSNSVYTKVLESFRIVKPYQVGGSGT
ncbi:hypothetical protein JOY44_14900 [Phormidium sp. CLA17]|uniref:hypothetical protein n=1 Tax=Leptolyngbya sp. Cla-17 TaxID=2803751 RepID=UPI0014917C68|nr:hypothetical protein [Leptolyngbya sp. Cla-17]MBM0742879.1 hypothetical protein [Leptolyngbya sp. Cla-17]